MRWTVAALLALLATGLVGAGCASTGEDGEAPPDSDTASPADAGDGTNTPTATPTPAPTDTPVPPTNTPEPPGADELLGGLAGDATVLWRQDADMDGDGTLEVAMLYELQISECDAPLTAFSLYRADASGVYADLVRPRRWRDGSPEWLPGVPTAAPACDQLVLSDQVLGPVALDFTRDGTAEIALGGVPRGCQTCDRHVGILDVRGGRPALRFEHIANGNPTELRASENDVVVAGTYRTVLDPGCCPSGSMEYRVTFAPQQGLTNLRGMEVVPRCRNGEASAGPPSSAAEAEQVLAVTCEPGKASFFAVDSGTIVNDGAERPLLGDAAMESRIFGGAGVTVEVSDYRRVTDTASTGDDGVLFLATEVRIE
ncbi:MAG: hypothetical protein U5Q44_10135 [Dehalococcoidia bacterium]|nr:hypothetical protein [Dehalococcoidia bacterium]